MQYKKSLKRKAYTIWWDILWKADTWKNKMDVGG
jgi:hypothetical protein